MNKFFWETELEPEPGKNVAAPQHWLGEKLYDRKPHLALNGRVVQLEAVADLNVPAGLLTNQGPVHLGGLGLLGLGPG